MLTLAILAGSLVFLFLLAFLTKRRFGVLGLALCAGALISSYWTDAVRKLLEQQGVSLISPPLEAVVAIGLSLLPSLLLLFSGPTYKSKFQRILVGVLFAVTALLLTLPALTTVFVVEKNVEQFINLINQYKNGVVAGLVAYAVLDTMLAQGFGGGKHGKGKGHKE